MRKYLHKIPYFLAILAVIFVVGGVVMPDMVQAQEGTFQDSIPIIGAAGRLGTQIGEALGTTHIGPEFITPSLSWIVEWILSIVAFFVGLAGVLLNAVINYTVIHVTENYDKLKSIEIAWKTLRDLANMTFIFVLLYAAIMTIIGRENDTKGIIVRIVAVAILINFSLFFTKLVIDAANVLALLFYDGIVPGASSASTLGTIFGQEGISNAFMQHLRLTSLYDPSTLDIGTVATIGVMGSIMLLIVAFVFFAVTIMFIIRYVVLIFTLILSPLAFVSFAVPGLNDLRRQWWDALTGQAFFAPAFFLLIWISLQVLSGIMGSFNLPTDPVTGTVATATFADGVNFEEGTVDPGAIAMFINFSVVIVFLIASLMIAKKLASKAGSGANTVTKWAMGLAGGAVFGGAATVGRRTIGRAGQFVGENEWLKEKAASGSFVGRFAARQSLTAGRGVGKSSFDTRATAGFKGVADATGVGGDFGKSGGKGGFADYRKKKAEDEAKFAASLAPSAKTIAKAKQALADAEKTGNKDEIASAQRMVDRLEGLDKKGVEERKDSLKEEKQATIDQHEAVKLEKDIDEGIKKAEKELAKARQAGDDATYSRLAKNFSDLQESKKRVSQRATEAKEQIEKEYDTKIKAVKKVEGAAKERKEEFAKATENSVLGHFGGYNYEAAAKIRKGKSSKDKATDLIKEMQKEEGGGEEKEEKTEEKKEGGDQTQTT